MDTLNIMIEWLIIDYKIKNDECGLTGGVTKLKLFRTKTILRIALERRNRASLNTTKYKPTKPSAPFLLPR